MEMTAILLTAAVHLTAVMPVFAAEEAQQREQCAISGHTCLYDK